MSFESRKFKVDWNQNLPKYYFDNSPFKTHLFNSFSLLFKEGERFFIETVKMHKDSVTDEQQLADIDSFIKQESWHSYTHQQYNNWLTSQGSPAEYIEENVVLRGFGKIKKRIGPKGWLTTTTSYEHITAIAAEYVLTHPEVMEKMHPHFRKLWEMHSIEEIEHKSVAFDTLTAIGGNPRRQLNCFVMGIVFIFAIFKITAILLKADKQLWKWRTFKDAASLLFNFRNGIVTKLFVPWTKSLKKDFHPNNHNTTTLLQRFATA